MTPTIPSELTATADAWDRLFAEAEAHPAVTASCWHDREPIYRVHDRLRVLFGHMDPQAVDDRVLIQGAAEQGVSPDDVLHLWTAWKRLTSALITPVVCAGPVNSITNP